MSGLTEVNRTSTRHRTSGELSPRKNEIVDQLRQIRKLKDYLQGWEIDVPD